jgi:hypothetical protein
MMPLWHAVFGFYLSHFWQIYDVNANNCLISNHGIGLTNVICLQWIYHDPNFQFQILVLSFLFRIFINFNGYFPITEENCSDNFIQLEKMIRIISILQSKLITFLLQRPQCHQSNCKWHLNLIICHLEFNSILMIYVNYFSSFHFWSHQSFIFTDFAMIFQKIPFDKKITSACDIKTFKLRLLLENKPIIRFCRDDSQPIL